MAEQSGIWLRDTYLTRPIVQNGVSYSVLVGKDWVKKHNRFPVEKGSLVVIGEIQPPGTLAHLLVLRVTYLQAQRDGSLVFNGNRVPDVPKNLI